MNWGEFFLWSGVTITWVLTLWSWRVAYAMHKLRREADKNLEEIEKLGQEMGQLMAELKKARDEDRS